MTATTRRAADPIAHDSFVDNLATLLGEEITAASITRSPYTTSFPIDDIEVVLASGRHMQLVRKAVRWSALIAPARAAKPRFLHDAAREAGVYQHLLPSAPAGPPACIGVIGDGGRPRWLVLERIRGVELFQVGELALWQASARWLARLHAAPEPVEAAAANSVPLLRLDATWWARWAARAIARGADPQAQRLVEAARPAVVEHLADAPAGFLHGEFYASNVLVGQRDDGSVRTAPVDWEMAAVGPGVIDLAALTSGRWSDTDRAAIEHAYADELGVAIDVDALRAARIACALQWLGWMPGWRAPAQHLHDWLGDIDSNLALLAHGHRQ